MRHEASAKCGTIATSVARNAIVIGGGLAGLTAAVYLARAGRRVTVFERRRYLGGRAITHLRRGFRFNLGPHAVYRDGGAARVLKELGVPIRGGSPKVQGAAILADRKHRLPASALSLLLTSLLSGSAKREGAALLWRLGRIDPKPFAAISAREWLDANVHDATLRQTVEALMRLGTYCADADAQSAAAALAQVRLGMRGVIYVDEGWQKLVDGLHSLAVAAGVNFVSSMRVVAVAHENGAVKSIELGGLELEDRNDTLSVALPDMAPEYEQGARIPAETVVMAIDPGSAAELLRAGGDASMCNEWASMRPVGLTCLDVALSSLPNPDGLFALGIDKPTYLSVHSAWAQLTPKGGALIHAAKYRKGHAPIADMEIEQSGSERRAEVAADERELEWLLDSMQPGWRNVLVHRRFLPAMTVSNAMVAPSMTRPSPATPVRGLYLAGDWVGDEGLLSDAALLSARAAAQAAIAS
jgi:phytoene dehydrogenase-like protein